jgi:hypothetical protein
VALLASLVLTTNAFSAETKKSGPHHKHHSGSAAHTQQQHAAKTQHVRPTHPSTAHNKSGKANAHKPARQHV